ncbi:MAG: hypothetical protein ACREBF_00010 [Candidatus Micrarchaeales archaeon]
MALGFWKLNSEKDLAKELRDKTEKVVITNSNVSGFRCEVEFGSNGVCFTDAKYKTRGFNFFLNPEGFLYLRVKGSGGGEHDCRITDDTALAHRLDATKNNMEEKKKMVLWMVKEMHDDLISPRGSLIKSTSIYRKELLRWIDGMYQTITNGQLK